MNATLAHALNDDCYCVTPSRQSLRAQLEHHLPVPGLPDRLLSAESHLFADSPVFVDQDTVDEMTRVVHAVEAVVRNLGFRQFVLNEAPVVMPSEGGARGVFSSYDFHLDADGPRLIEINTNAGGVLLNLYLAAAQQACCDEIASLFPAFSSFTELENGLVAMFQTEWAMQCTERPLRSIAIVDEAPATQYLYPEFLLFQSMFRRHGIKALIADPGEISRSEGALWIGTTKVDLVYNRLTDFYLQAPASSVLLRAFQEGAAVFTPSPRAYALYADKRNLILLSDSKRLQDFGVENVHIETLTRSVPHTVRVETDNADELWRQRRRLFFKPAIGYGSRGAYRGAKLTRRVWEDIMQHEYIAQSMVAPSERQMIVNGEKRPLKADVRCVTYDGRIQQLSARLYEGQVTNLRTEGGGLASVFVVPVEQRSPSGNPDQV
ncbi:MAG: hypothetical protein QF921_01740 [Pseudomonadales bacterium]|mgnify:CR=1 FL=1|jgi:hypothetical protein|nr:hypothetical protein [Pseudomonadales bacterium]MDP6471039.1 hypothetical protein [Pseudomonadales bacterium]MDP6825775.1 hypothetical protein [Pseudomonadales bacterium]MDP6970231.1 hypothetical protein [Pseudomonadales bacterium]|tara:strand:+ start:102 stop:1406 length:1305 start_codon:yes stop_codon:yes gene_type:complete